MARRPLYYTFGNHMHWVDMQWLWGYHVLPGSVRDMLRLIDETGARGNVNFDAIGYEKMAAECPEALGELREAVAAGKVEPVGCSYGQPYGLFQGGESNVRQLTYGVRTTRRLLGVRPRAFWEEEFYFFPQLPQLLAQCGYTGACLFFQWTWHTPEVPKEPCSLILWEGIDGTRLPTLPRNDLNVHQWPEEFDGLLERAAEQQSSRAANGEQAGAAPAIVQWLELMPSRDWMCRSELLLPRLKELMADPRFEVRARTVSQLIEDLQGSPPLKRGDATRTTSSIHRDIPVRRYSMDDVWHGMTLGKNADRHPRASRGCQQAILSAESLSACAGMFGRPYASWDVYPTWEMDEAWRQALAAQHHDNHECEGLCGFVGHMQFNHARALAREVESRHRWLIGARAGALDWELVRNPVGWARRVVFRRSRDSLAESADVPPFGYAVSKTGRRVASRRARETVRRSRGRLDIRRGRLRVRIDAGRGVITEVTNEAGSSSVFGSSELAQITARAGGAELRVRRVNVDTGRVRGRLLTTIERQFVGGGHVETIVELADDESAVDLRIWSQDGADPNRAIQPDPGLDSAFKGVFRLERAAARVIADSPFAAHEVHGVPEGRRKYPRGDWMTSPQWFETVRGAFTSAGFVDLVDAHGNGLMLSHSGMQQWFRRDDGVACVLSALDPWDEGRYTADCRIEHAFRIFPHGTMSNADRARAARQFIAPAAMSMRPCLDENIRPVGGGTASGVKQDIPRSFGALEVCNAPNVLAHAFFRESAKSGEHIPDWAGHRMYKESDGVCDHPYVIRLVEWNGEPAEVVLKLAGPAAMAAKTNLLGEVRDEETKRRTDEEVSGWSWADTGWLKAEHPVEPPSWARGAKLKGKPITWSAVRFRMRPREIATIYADLVMGRKQWRDLDAKREVWATVHKQT